MNGFDPTFGAAGPLHRAGAVPDPGVLDGLNRVLSDDGTWVPSPPGPTGAAGIPGPTGAAGAVGGVAGQIAKISGCRVVGIVGSDEKSRLIQEHFKFDSAINYKKALTAKVLQDKIKESCPNGVDVYFDNVGGPISEAVMQNMNTQGRIVVCGQIALYNLNKIPKETEIEPLLLARSIAMKGFSVSDFEEQFPEATQQLSKWLSEGKIESSETILDGFANLPKALIGLFSGKNIGKMIVKAAA